MIFDNDKFTTEQKQIITEIGRKHKQNRAKNFQQIYVNAIIIVVFFVGMLIGLYFLDPVNVYRIVLLLILGAVVGALNFFKAKKNLSNVLSRSDYEVGLYFADKDDEVIGNIEKRYRNNKRTAIILGVMGIFLALFVGLVTFLSNDPPINYDNLSEITGRLEAGRRDSDDDLQMTLEGDTTVYRIVSIYTAVMDMDSFFDEVHLGDEVVFLVGEIKHVNDDVVRDVYYLEVNSIVYMNRDLMIRGDERNQGFGKGIVLVGGMIGVASVLWVLVWPLFFSNKRRKNEKYDLTIKTERVDVLNTDDIFAASRKPKIVTYAPKWMVILMFVLLLAFSAASVASLIFITDAGNRALVTGFLGIFVLVSVAGCYDGLKNNEMIDGDYLFTHRFGKERKIPLKDISRITVFGTLLLFRDANSKILARIDRNTCNLDLILERISEYGAVIEGM